MSALCVRDLLSVRFRRYAEAPPLLSDLVCQMVLAIPKVVSSRWTSTSS